MLAIFKQTSGRVVPLIQALGTKESSMEILGYIGFAVLIFLAVTWTIGVRTQFGAGTGTVIGALFFLASVLVLIISGTSTIHSLWIIPAGFIIPLVVTFIGTVSQALLFPFRLVAGMFANIIRIGIPAEKIRAGQDAGLRATVDEWARRRKSDGDGT